jgi:hypothetical protein
MAKNPPRTGLRRRDATGHLDPRYAAELLEQSGETGTSDPPPSGFVTDASDDLAEQLGEDFVQAATSGEDGDADAGDELITDEPSVPDGDDDDIGFEPEELAFPAPKPTRTKPEPAPARRAPKPKAKAAKSKPAKAKAKAKTAKTKPAKAKPAKAKLGRGSSVSKTKTTKAKAAKAKPVRKKAKQKPARKSSKRTR